MDKKAPQCFMPALKFSMSADENVEHPNLVKQNPRLITQDAAQTLKHLRGKSECNGLYEKSFTP